MGCSLEHELGLHLTNQARTSSNLVAALTAMLTRALDRWVGYLRWFLDSKLENQHELTPLENPALTLASFGHLPSSLEDLLSSELPDPLASSKLRSMALRPDGPLSCKRSQGTSGLERKLDMLKLLTQKTHSSQASMELRLKQYARRNLETKTLNFNRDLDQQTLFCIFTDFRLEWPRNTSLAGSQFSNQNLREPASHRLVREPASHRLVRKAGSEVFHKIFFPR